MNNPIENMKRMIEPLRTRIANTVARAILQLVNDGAGLQLVQMQVLAGETREALERIQQYGLTSHPHPGAEAAVVFVGGRRDHGLVLAIDDRRYRLQSLAEGEVALYTDEGDHVMLKRGRIVDVKAGTKVHVDAPLAEITGNVTIGGTLQVTGNITAQAAVAVTGAVSAASLATTGAIAASGGISDVGGSMASMRTAFNLHTHQEHGTGGGITGPPSSGTPPESM